MMSAFEKPTQPVKAAENDRTQAELASMRDEQPADELDPVEEASLSRFRPAILLVGRYRDQSRFFARKRRSTMIRLCPVVGLPSAIGASPESWRLATSGEQSRIVAI
jgi:hypothetical protein